MKQHLLRLTFLSLAISVGGSAFAQSDIPYIFTARPKNTFSASLKVMSGGAKVKFGNLGTIPYEAVQYIADVNGKLVLSPDGKPTPTGNYFFHDGQIQGDSAAARGQESSGQVTAGYTVVLPNGRYIVYGQTLTKDANGKPPGDPDYIPTPTLDTSPAGELSDNLSYKDGQTRYWLYQDNSQAADGYVNFHAYSSQSSGMSRQADSGGSAGFELELNRELGLLDRKGSSWGFSVSFGVTDINAKTAGIVHSNLVTEAARFSLLGNAAPPAPYQAPTYGDLKVFNADGTPYMVKVFAADGTVQKNPDNTDMMTQKVITGGLETTTPLASTPTGGVTTTTTTNGAEVDGRWQMKGAYYMLRMGPSFRYQFTPRISVSGGIGLATAYVGSVYSAQETLLFPNGVPIMNTTSGTPVSAPSIKGELRNRDLLLGYYGELNLEYWITFRTGFFIGLVYEHVGAYTQELGDRTASVNIGSGTAFRVGVTTRF